VVGVRVVVGLGALTTDEIHDFVLALTLKFKFKIICYLILVWLPGFARDFYCQLCLYVSLFLCLFVSMTLYLCLSVSPLYLSQT
jgi:hypothetical protein